MKVITLKKIFRELDTGIYNNSKPSDLNYDAITDFLGNYEAYRLYSLDKFLWEIQEPLQGVDKYCIIYPMDMVCD